MEYYCNHHVARLRRRWEKYRNKFQKNQNVLWIRLVHRTEKCWIPVSMALALVYTTKMVHMVFNPSMAKCTKRHIIISVITEPYSYLWSFNNKGCEIRRIRNSCLFSKNSYTEGDDNPTVRQPDQIQGDQYSLCTWWSQYRKLQVMFKVSPASLQTFIDTPNCVLVICYP
jgi:hypothetical protein